MLPNIVGRNCHYHFDNLIDGGLETQKRPGLVLCEDFDQNYHAERIWMSIYRLVVFQKFA